MKSRHYRLALLALLASTGFIVGCSSQPPTHPAPAGHASGAGAATGTAKPRGGTQPAAPALPDTTGIPACDDYLASYVACHRAAGIFTPDQVEPRYEMMRTSLLRDSQDPAIRPRLGARCTALAAQLREALHGKPCGPGGPAAPTTSSGSR